MSSPVKWYGTEFFLGFLKNIVPKVITDNISNAKSSITTAKQKVTELRQFMEQALALLSLFILKNINPIGSLFTTLNKLFSKLIKDFLTTGAQAILIHPWNRVNKRKLDLYSLIGLPSARILGKAKTPTLANEDAENFQNRALYRATALDSRVKEAEASRATLESQLSSQQEKIASLRSRYENCKLVRDTYYPSPVGGQDGVITLKKAGPALPVSVLEREMRKYEQELQKAQEDLALIESALSTTPSQREVESLKKKREWQIVSSKLSKGAEKVINGTADALNKLIEYRDTPGLQIPVMTPKEAFEELKASFFNKRDPYRPRWSKSTTVAGCGVLLVSPDPQFGELASVLEMWNLFAGLIDETSGKDLRDAADAFGKIAEQYKADLIRSGLIPPDTKENTVGALTKTALKSGSKTRTADLQNSEALSPGLETQGKYRQQVADIINSSEGLVVGDGHPFSLPSIGPGTAYPEYFITSGGETIYFHYETERDFEAAKAKWMPSNYAGIVERFTWGPRSTNTSSKSSAYFTPQELSSTVPLVYTPVDGVKLDSRTGKFTVDESLPELHWHGLSVSNITYLREAVETLMAFANVLQSAVQNVNDAATGLIRAFFKKIERIISSVEKILTAVERLQKLFVALPGLYAFTISPQTGGVDAMISSLSHYLDDPSANTDTLDYYGNPIVPVARKLSAPLCALFFAGAGGLGADYYNELFKAIGEAIERTRVAYQVAGDLELDPPLQNLQVVPPGPVDFRVISKGNNTHFNYTLTHATTNLVVKKGVEADHLSIADNVIAITPTVRKSPSLADTEKTAYILKVESYLPSYASNLGTVVAREWTFFVQEGVLAWPFTFTVSGLGGAAPQDAPDIKNATTLFPLQHFTEKVTETWPTIPGVTQPRGADARLVYAISTTPFLKYSYTITQELIDEEASALSGAYVYSGETNIVYTEAQTNFSQASYCRLNLSSTGKAGRYLLAVTATTKRGDSKTDSYSFITAAALENPALALDDDGSNGSTGSGGTSGANSGLGENGTPGAPGTGTDGSGGSQGDGANDFNLRRFLSQTYTGPVTLYNIPQGELVDSSYVVNGQGTIGSTLPGGIYTIDLNGLRGTIKINGKELPLSIDRLRSIIYVPYFPIDLRLETALGSAIRYFWDNEWHYQSLSLVLTVPEEKTFTATCLKDGRWTPLLDVTVKLRDDSLGICGPV